MVPPRREHGAAALFAPSDYRRLACVRRRIRSSGGIDGGKNELASCSVGLVLLVYLFNGVHCFRLFLRLPRRLRHGGVSLTSCKLRCAGRQTTRRR